MRSIVLAVIVIGILLTTSYAQLGEGPTAPPKNPGPEIKGKKVCLADVANSSVQPISTDNLKERFYVDLQKQQINVNNAYLVTVLADRLGLTPENKIAAKRQKCDFVLLSEVAKPNLKDQSPDHLKLDFALFKKGNWKTPLQIGSIATDEPKDPNAVTLAAVDKAAEQVVPTLKNKR